MSTCVPVLGEESESILKLRQMIKDALTIVEPLVFKKEGTPIVVPVPAPVPGKCPDCKGTGFITHGDGHKTSCPKYPGCTKGAGEKPKTEVITEGKTEVKIETPKAKIEVKTPIVVKETPKIIKSAPLNAYIKMYSIPLCIPCATWKRNMLDRLVMNGWTVEVDDTGSKYSRFPVFEVYINGNMEVVHGYMDAGELQRIKNKFK